MRDATARAICCKTIAAPLSQVPLVSMLRSSALMCDRRGGGPPLFHPVARWNLRFAGHISPVRLPFCRNRPFGSVLTPAPLRKRCNRPSSLRGLGRGGPWSVYTRWPSSCRRRSTRAETAGTSHACRSCWPMTGRRCRRPMPFAGLSYRCSWVVWDFAPSRPPRSALLGRTRSLPPRQAPRHCSGVEHPRRSDALRGCFAEDSSFEPQPLQRGLVE